VWTLLFRDGKVSRRDWVERGNRYAGTLNSAHHTRGMSIDNLSGYDSWTQEDRTPLLRSARIEHPAYYISVGSETHSTLNWDQTPSLR
jgi:hypothetical protein